MSYEGFEEYLCEKGHYNTRDVYGDEFTACPVCDSKLIYWHPVDQTNGVVPGDSDTVWAPLNTKGHEEVEHKDHKGNIYYELVTLWEPAGKDIWRKIE